jgi:hypothetical protein
MIPAMMEPTMTPVWDLDEGLDGGDKVGLLGLGAVGEEDVADAGVCVSRWPREDQEMGTYCL